MKGSSWLGGFVLCVFAVVQQAVADDESRVLKCLDDCVPVGQWQFNLALGAGLRQNPLVEKSDTPLIVLPEVSYYGQRFFLKNFEFGFTLFENPRHQFHLLVTPSTDQMYFNRWDPLNFTDAAGFASTHNFAAPAPPAGQSSRTYSVTINESQIAPPQDSIGAQPPAPGDEASGPGTGGDSSSSSSAPSQIDYSGGSMEGNVQAGIRINDGDSLMVNASSATLLGREGNIIFVSRVADDTLTIDGLSERDEVRLYGEVMAFTEETGRELTVSVGTTRLAAIAATSESTDRAPPSADETITRETRSRRAAGLAGFEYLHSRSWVNLHLQALTDFTGVHQGQELRLAMIFPWQYQNHRWAATLGANYQSYQVLDYYYGLDESEVAHPQYAYQVDRGGWSQMLRLDWQMALSRRWSLRAMAQYKHLNKDVSRSPLVSESGVGSVFIGGVYHF